MAIFLQFIRSDQNHIARHSERGKKIKQIKKGNSGEFIGLDFGKLRRIAENGETWREMDVK